ncbi:hypothetical protein [Marinimicrobium alkaliphilum]|uniref:hypothetical protein n=1 Tax=Marinimicrobium alkaliphilum TaxID=2202654 RepID=UPI000DB96CBC|nr:hypothetical protein [Marinimicrobium alkaliphilum]
MKLISGGGMVVKKLWLSILFVHFLIAVWSFFFNELGVWGFVLGCFVAYGSLSQMVAYLNRDVMFGLGGGSLESGDSPSLRFIFFCIAVVLYIIVMAMFIWPGQG